MLKELDDGEYGDWKEVFKYNAPDRAPQDTVTELTPFSCEDVKSILGSALGDNDGPNWLMAGQLKDKRWFFISAGCDYTGWG